MKKEVEKEVEKVEGNADEIKPMGSKKSSFVNSFFGNRKEKQIEKDQKLEIEKQKQTQKILNDKLIEVERELEMERHTERLENEINGIDTSNHSNTNTKEYQSLDSGG